MSKILFVVSPTINALVDPRKGTTGNKIDCATQHFKNSMSSNVTIAAAGGLTALAGKAVLSKSGALQNMAQTSTVKKIFNYIKNAPKPVKVIAGAIAGLSLIYRSYKAGTIEQKYIDRAQFVDNTFKEGGKSADSAKKA